MLLRFNASFHNEVFLPGRLFNVRFTIKRSTFVFMHAALKLVSCGGLPARLVLPPGTSSPAAAPALMARRMEAQARAGAAKALVWKDRRLNAEQRAAVAAAVAGEQVPLPYLIYGPPGTGKTSTVIEAAVQVGCQGQGHEGERGGGRGRHARLPCFAAVLPPP